MNLSVNIGKLKLKNPVMAASGTFGYAKEFEGLIDFKKIGALITKTITLRPRQGNPMPRICETASGMLNAIGLQNEGIDDFIKEKLPYLSKLKIPIIVSISGDSVKEFCVLAKRLEKVRSINGIELNISCPNVNEGRWMMDEGMMDEGRWTPVRRSLGEGGRDDGRLSAEALAKAEGTMDEGREEKRKRLIAQDKDATYEVVKNVRKVTKKTLITKLSPNVTDIVEIAEAARRAGSDAVSLVNTFLGMAIDINTRKPSLGNITGGLSGPCIKPIALRMVWEVYRSVNIPIIGIGGIMNAEDAIEFIIAGASAVQIATANFIEPDACEKVIKGIGEYLKKNKIKNIKEIAGILTG